MIKIRESTGYKKLNFEKKRIVDRANKKLLYIIHSLGDFTLCIANNPAIHDCYGDFYVYKFSSRDYSVRLLYKYNQKKDILEIHKIHFKESDSDNSKYIEVFEKYVEENRR